MVTSMKSRPPPGSSSLSGDVADRDQVQDGLIGGQGEGVRRPRGIKAAHRHGGKSEGGRLEQDVLGGVADLDLDERLGLSPYLWLRRLGTAATTMTAGAAPTVDWPTAASFSPGRRSDTSQVSARWPSGR